MSRRPYAAPSTAPSGALSPLLSAVEPVKAATFRGLMALPDPVQRVVAGRPVVRDGQTLATETQMTLRLRRLLREPTLESLPVPEGRLVMQRQTALAGRDQPIGAVRDLPVGGRPGRLYVPTRAPTPGPLLVFFHGGGFVHGDLDTHDPACRFLAERSGVRILAVDYRLAPEHPFPAAYDDACAAYEWVTTHADSLGADPARLAVGGDSAGGNLAAVTALTAAREGWPLAWQLLIYPVTQHVAATPSRSMFTDFGLLNAEFVRLATDSYLPDPASRTDWRAAPDRAEVPPGLAPAYVVTAGFDPLRDEGEAYARKLAEAGVEVELERFPEHIHGFLHFVGVGRAGRAANATIAAKLGAALAADA